MKDVWLRGTEILPELARMTGKPAPITYRKMMDLAASGRLPELQRVDGKTGCWESKLSKLGVAIGMSVPDRVAA